MPTIAQDITIRVPGGVAGKVLARAEAIMATEGAGCFATARKPAMTSPTRSSRSPKTGASTRSKIRQRCARRFASRSLAALRWASWNGPGSSAAMTAAAGVLAGEILALSCSRGQCSPDEMRSYVDSPRLFQRYPRLLLGAGARHLT
jgi:hypothetical protein